jgi:hypothetical protein
MDAPGMPDTANLARLENLVQLGESLGLYLDITDLGSYRENDVPPWYSAMPESDRWTARHSSGKPAPRPAPAVTACSPTT